MATSWPKSTREAKMMNSPEISTRLRFSLKPRTASRSTQRMLASTMPITVTASNPDSAWIRSAAVNTPNTDVSITRLCRYSGIR